MLQNASSLGKISFDTAEDEPSKIWETSASFANEALDSADCVPGAGVRVGVRGPEVRLEVPRAGEVISDTDTSGRRSSGASEPRTIYFLGELPFFWQNFSKISLVFGCIGTDLCKQKRVFQHFSKSTRLSA